MTAPFLTIGIPTYNRLVWLSKTLPILLEQAAVLPSGVIEILASDNCSTDGTQEFLETLAPLHPALRVHRTENNIGGEGNFFLIPRLAAGRYLYMIGDDDALEPGALAQIYEILSSEKYQYLVINFAQYDNTLTRCVKPNFMGARKNVELTNVEDCLARVPHLAMGYIASWAGRKEFFNTISETDYRHFTQWGMSIMVDRYIGISKMPSGYFLSRALLRSRRAETPAGFDYFAWFVAGGAEVLGYAVAKKAITPSQMRRRKNELLLKVCVKRIIYERMTGVFDSAHTLALLFQSFRGCWAFWLLCLPAATMPGLGSLAKLFRRG